MPSREDLAKDITAGGGTALAVQADVSDPAQVRSLFDAVKKNYGQVDILVNNAGVWQVASLAEFTPKHYQEVFTTNVLGPLVVTHEALKHFPKTGGRVINISSVATRGGMPGDAVYGASKAALEAFTINWRWSLGRAISPSIRCRRDSRKRTCLRPRRMSSRRC